jgi:hypothetical protein
MKAAHPKPAYLFSYFALVMYPFLKFVFFNDYPVISLEILLFTISWLVVSALLAFYFQNKIAVIMVYLTLFLIFFSTGEKHLKAYELVLLGLLGIGLLIFFYFHFHHLHQVVLVFIAGLLISEIFLSGGGVFHTKHMYSMNAPETASAPEGVVAKPKHVLYLIVDEHIGPDGLPASIESSRKLKNELLSFYPANHFTLYTKAFSNYYDTEDSIPNALNLSAEDKARYYFANSKRDLDQNHLFDYFRKQGYLIDVYQADYINFCSKPQPVNLCYEYVKNSIHAVANQPYSVWEKMWVIGSEFIAANSIYEKFNKKVKDHNILKTRTGPLRTIPELLEALKKDMLSSRQKTFFFAHLLMPHGSYVYNANCSPLPVGQWEENREYGLDYPDIKNSEAAYQRKNKLYADQTRCLNRWLSDLFNVLRENGLYDDMTIIIHGDHGSRIARNYAPFYENAQKIGKEDLVTAYSTLFAVKQPAQKKGELNSSQRSLINLLKNLLGESASESDEQDHFVFFKEGENKSGLFKVPMTAF